MLIIALFFGGCYNFIIAHQFDPYTPIELSPLNVLSIAIHRHYVILISEKQNSIKSGCGVSSEHTPVILKLFHNTIKFI